MAFRVQLPSFIGGYMKAVLLILSILITGVIAQAQTTNRIAVQAVLNIPFATNFSAIINYRYAELRAGAMTVSDGQISVQSGAQTFVYLVPVTDTDYLKSHVNYSLSDSQTMLRCQTRPVVST